MFESSQQHKLVHDGWDALLRDNPICGERHTLPWT